MKIVVVRIPMDPHDRAFAEELEMAGKAPFH
jgi:hypothetical protein